LDVKLRRILKKKDITCRDSENIQLGRSSNVINKVSKIFR